jgi:hypothetical protein
MNTKLLTVGDLVTALEQPIHKIEYLLSSRNIQPVQRAGRFRLYKHGVIDRLQHEIVTMQKTKNRGVSNVAD